MSSPHLLAPLTIGHLNLRNRVVMAPLTRGRAGPTFTANALMAEYYSQRASAALIITEATSISVQARGWFNTPDIFAHKDVAGWRLVTDAVHKRSGLIFCQIWHTGRTSHSSFRKGIPGFEGDKCLAVAPSPIPKKSESGKQLYTLLPGAVDIETPRELSTSECKDVVDQFRHAAQLAKDAGFDGVEIHGAGGYIIDQFLQTTSNERSDEYGGSTENRFRLADEIIRAVLTIWPSHAVGFKMAPNGSYNGMGSPDNHESFMYFAERLAEFKLAYLHLQNDMSLCYHHVARPVLLDDLRKVFPGVLIGNCGYTAETAEQEVESGKADLVSFGRLYLSNPDLVERLEAGVPLSPPAEFSTWWSTADNVMGADGYTDFKKMSEA